MHYYPNDTALWPGYSPTVYDNVCPCSEFPPSWVYMLGEGGSRNYFSDNFTAQATSYRVEARFTTRKLGGRDNPNPKFV